MSLESMKEDRTRKKSNAYFLKNKHPELFEVVPIRGRYNRHHSHGHSHRASTECQTSETKIVLGTSIKESRPADIGEVLKTNIRCPNTARPASKDDRKNNTVRMCSIAVSTVMMLAQKTYDDITMEHARHTEEYFNGLKQVDGYPTNVKQLFHLLTTLKKNGKILSSFDEEKNEENQAEKDQESTTENFDDET